MDEREIPTPGELATMCVDCGVNEPRLRTGVRGPKPRRCDACQAEFVRRVARDQQRELRKDATYRAMQAAYLRDWVSRNPGQRGRSHRRVRYGLEPEHVQAWYDFQNGACALCGEPLKRGFNVDHDHNTGIIRGLLHNLCNANLDAHPNRERYLNGWVY